MAPLHAAGEEGFKGLGDVAPGGREVPGGFLHLQELKAQALVVSLP